MNIGCIDSAHSKSCPTHSCDNSSIGEVDPRSSEDTTPEDSGFEIGLSKSFVVGAESSDEFDTSIVIQTEDGFIFLELESDGIARNILQSPSCGCERIRCRVGSTIDLGGAFDEIYLHRQEWGTQSTDSNAIIVDPFPDHIRITTISDLIESTR